MAESYRWTDGEITRLVSYMKEGGHSLDDLAEKLGTTRKRVASKASQVRKEAKARGVELPKLKVVRKASSAAKELFDELFGEGGGENDEEGL